jgi:hypothetical protein
MVFKIAKVPKLALQEDGAGSNEEEEAAEDASCDMSEDDLHVYGDIVMVSLYCFFLIQ